MLNQRALDASIHFFFYCHHRGYNPRTAIEKLVDEMELRNNYTEIKKKAEKKIRHGAIFVTENPKHPADNFLKDLKLFGKKF